MIHVEQWRLQSTEANRQLNESVYYRKLSADPTSQYSTEVKQCVDSMFKRGLIEKKVKNFLVSKHPRAARFYLLPKIQQTWKPGETHRCPKWCPDGKYLALYRPCISYGTSVRQLPSYIQDTTDFIHKLRRLPRLPPGSLLVTLDVSSLYTNIPHEVGITAGEEYFNRRELQEPPTADLCELIRLVLTKNSFVFNKTNYLQIHGTTMGTRTYGTIVR